MARYFTSNGLVFKLYSFRYMSASPYFSSSSRIAEQKPKEHHTFCVIHLAATAT